MSVKTAPWSTSLKEAIAEVTTKDGSPLIIPVQDKPSTAISICGKTEMNFA